MERVQTADGMTLVELLIAMTVMAIGISALVAGFSSGILAINRSAAASTAGAVADQQMESYRRLSFSSIATDTNKTTAAETALDGIYVNDPAHPITPPATPAAVLITVPCPGDPNVPAYYYCNPSRPASGSNGGTYRIDSYVTWDCPVTGWALGGTSSAPTCKPPGGIPSSRSVVKKVTIVVRDLSKTPPQTPQTLIRSTSTFDASTG